MEGYDEEINVARTMTVLIRIPLYVSSAGGRTLASKMSVD